MGLSIGDEVYYPIGLNKYNKGVVVSVNPETVIAQDIYPLCRTAIIHKLLIQPDDSADLVSALESTCFKAHPMPAKSHLGEEMTEDNQNITKTPSLDYDLYVIDPNNQDTTPEQLRDCIYDALKVLDERTKTPRISC